MWYKDMYDYVLGDFMIYLHLKIDTIILLKLLWLAFHLTRTQFIIVGGLEMLAFSCFCEVENGIIIAYLSYRCNYLYYMFLMH